MVKASEMCCLTYYSGCSDAPAAVKREDGREGNTFFPENEDTVASQRIVGPTQFYIPTKSFAPHLPVQQLRPVAKQRDTIWMVWA